MDNIQKKVALSRQLTLSLLVVLLSVYAFKTLVLWDQPLKLRLALFAMQLVPFLLVLPGVLRHSWRAFAWLCFILQLYFMQAVMVVFSPQRAAWDWLSLALVVSIFIIAMLHIRWFRHAEAGLEHS